MLSSGTLEQGRTSPAGRWNPVGSNAISFATATLAGAAVWDGGSAALIAELIDLHEQLPMPVPLPRPRSWPASSCFNRRASCVVVVSDALRAHAARVTTGHRETLRRIDMSKPATTGGAARVSGISLRYGIFGKDMKAPRFSAGPRLTSRARRAAASAS